VDQVRAGAGVREHAREQPPLRALELALLLERSRPLDLDLLARRREPGPRLGGAVDQLLGGQECAVAVGQLGVERLDGRLVHPGIMVGR
jgi:hypothetical protein